MVKLLEVPSRSLFLLPIRYGHAPPGAVHVIIVLRCPPVVQPSAIPHNPPHEQLLVRLGAGGVSSSSSPSPPSPGVVCCRAVVSVSSCCLLVVSPSCSPPLSRRPRRCAPSVVVWDRRRRCPHSLSPVVSSSLAPAGHPASSYSQRWGRVLSAGCLGRPAVVVVVVGVPSCCPVAVGSSLSTHNPPGEQGLATVVAACYRCQ